MNRFGPPRQQPCGTPAAARWHYRHGEKPCQACLQAGRRRFPWEAGALSPDLRPIRNGLPEFVPYVYRGLGYDQHYLGLYYEKQKAS